MLTLPPAPQRAALLDALEVVVAAAGPDPLVAPPLAPELLASALASRGPRQLATVVFRAAGMPEPEVVIMGGSGAATAFRAQGKAVVRIGSDLAPSAAIASTIRAAAALWRQAADVKPAVTLEDEVATSVCLSLGPAEALAAHDLGERDRTAALLFLVAVQSLARDDARRTAAVADELGPPLDGAYEDALRLLALRGAELRSRLRVDASRSPFERLPVAPVGHPVDAAGEPNPPPTVVASLDDARRHLAEHPCPCGGRWRIAEQRSAQDGADVELTIVCRVCLQWRRASWRVSTP
jgi:hypothetical protein